MRRLKIISNLIFIPALAGISIQQSFLRRTRRSSEHKATQYFAADAQIRVYKQPDRYSRAGGHLHLK
jgi:hypothetical protein